ncbi:MAG TPA: hypothetical protein VGP97_21085 [Burkholderiales bacterium]|nr:hypothetical protein [Burkholderiales bacterium]
MRQISGASWKPPSAPNKPPSASAITGSFTACAMVRACSTSASSERSQVSGMPKRLAAVA